MQQHPGCLMLAGGRPAGDLFPLSVQRMSEDLSNYGPAHAAGTADLKKWAKDFVQRFHAPQGGWEHRDTILTSGNTDGMSKAILLLTDANDIILADEFTYPGITSAALPLDRRVHGVAMDDEGMKPDALDAKMQVLQIENGDCKGPKAKMIYVCPHGQNPTATTMSLERKSQLYAVAQKHKLTILEDDPYFFVNLGAGRAPADSTEAIGSSTFPKSFLSMDVDGRVVRLDSVSKFLAPGFRLGWVTGDRTLLQKWAVLSECTTWGVSGFQQEAFAEVMRELGVDGLHTHLQRLQHSYAVRRDRLVAACEAHLQGLCRWTVPDFGMFLWLQVLGVDDTADLVDELIGQYGVAMVPGSAFRASASQERCSYFRVSFSQLTDETADEAMLRVRRALLARQGNGQVPA